jgi:hypothetical protein
MIDECGTDRKTREKPSASAELIKTRASNRTDQAVGEISWWTLESDLSPRRSASTEKMSIFVAFVQMLYSEQWRFLTPNNELNHQGSLLIRQDSLRRVATNSLA